MTNINLNTLSILPTQEGLDKTHYAIREKLKSCLLLQVRSAVKGLGRKTTVIDHVQSLDINKKFTPSLFCLYRELRSSMNQGNVSQVEKCLDWLITSTPQDLYANSLRIDSILVDPMETLLSHEHPSFPLFAVKGSPAALEKISGESLINGVSKIKSTLDELKEIDPEVFAEIEEFVTRISLYSGEKTRAVSLTHVQFFGALYLSVPAQINDLSFDSKLFYLDLLVHESAHNRLNTFFFFDKIMTNPDEPALSPLRGVPRPVYKVLHGTFALCRLTRLFNRLTKIQGGNVHLPQLELLTQRFNQGMATLKEKMQATSFGLDLLESMIQTVQT